MNDENHKSSKQSASGSVLAVVDIGSNSIRMSIGQVLPDGQVEVLEQARRAVHLGQDTFRRSRLGRAVIHAAVAILKEFKARIDVYGADRVRIVATSAIREARNAEIFRDRVLMASGMEVEIISSSQEGRMTVLAVRHAIGKDIDMMDTATMISEVGGGSTVLSLLQDGRIKSVHNLRMGAIRLQEELHAGGVPAEKAFDSIHNEIDSVLVPVKEMMPLDNVKTYFALGGDVRFAAEQVGTSTSNPSIWKISKSKLDGFLNSIQHLSTEDLGSTYNIPFEDAETLVPALMMCQALLGRTKAKELMVPNVSMRDGLLQDLALQLSGDDQRMYSDEVIQSSVALAEKYKVNIKHARRVADCALWLFDKLKPEHGLGARQRLYLESASLLQETGMFISPRGYHKHTYYIISHEEIFGLTEGEVEVVAHVARYHRRSMPKTSHVEYMSLNRENRILVNRLSAILRLARALDVASLSDLEKLDGSVEEGEFRVMVHGMPDGSLRARSFEIRSDQFEDVFGLKIRLVSR